jgi:hypothetical protein
VRFVQCLVEQLGFPWLPGVCRHFVSQNLYAHSFRFRVVAAPVQRHDDKIKLPFRILHPAHAMDRRLVM